MNGNSIALDSNQAIAVLNDKEGAGAWIAGYTDVVLPIPVIGELRFGALNSKRAAENMARINKLIQRSRVLDIGLATAEAYADVRLQLRRDGTPIPENDVWIAALCKQHDLTIATSDDHFDLVEGLRVLKR